MYFANEDCWVTDNSIIAQSRDVDEAYFYFVLLDSLKLNTYRVGSGQPLLNQNILRQINVKIPNNKFIRVIIGYFFEVIDKKITLNNQINETLEAMAQALFKSWFIDFEPVKAKIEAKDAGQDAEGILLAAMSAISGKEIEALKTLQNTAPEEYAELKTIAEQFPDSLEESELGLIPKGWEVSSLGKNSICFDSKRIPLSKIERELKKPGNIPYYGATSVMDYINESIFDGTYLLVGEDGSVIKEDGTPFTQYIWGKSWVNNHAHVLKGKGEITTEHLLLFMRSTNISAYVTGAVQLKLNQKNMRNIPFIRANDELNKVFGKKISSLFTIYKNNSHQNQILTELRDTLLPKLLSGEIDVSNVEIDELPEN